MSPAEKTADLKKVNGIFEMRVKNAAGKEGIWTIDFKKVRFSLVLERWGEGNGS